MSSIWCFFDIDGVSGSKKRQKFGHNIKDQKFAQINLLKSVEITWKPHH